VSRHKNNSNNDVQEINPEMTGSTGEVTDPASGAASEPTDSGKPTGVSPQKLAANRANARHSTGPTTPEGKEKSSQNSRKHGFFARNPLPPGEEGDKLWEHYGDLVAGIWEHYRPVGYMEGLLTEKIIAESIRFSRLLTYEGKYVGEQRAFYWEGASTASSASKVPLTANCSNRFTSWSVCRRNAKVNRTHRDSPSVAASIRASKGSVISATLSGRWIWIASGQNRPRRLQSSVYRLPLSII
jgi:hypothetical protein